MEGFHIPYDVICLITRLLDRKSLRSCNVVNNDWHDATNPLVWSSIKIFSRGNTPSPAVDNFLALKSACRAISQKPHRAQYIRRLSIDTRIGFLGCNHEFMPKFVMPHWMPSIDLDALARAVCDALMALPNLKFLHLHEEPRREHTPIIAEKLSQSNFPFLLTEFSTNMSFATLVPFLRFQHDLDSYVFSEMREPTEGLYFPKPKATIPNDILPALRHIEGGLNDILSLVRDRHVTSFIVKDPIDKDHIGLRPLTLEYGASMKHIALEILGHPIWTMNWFARRFPEMLSFSMVMRTTFPGEDDSLRVIIRCIMGLMPKLQELRLVGLGFPLWWTCEEIFRVVTLYPRSALRRMVLGRLGIVYTRLDEQADWVVEA